MILTMNLFRNFHDVSEASIGSVESVMDSTVSYFL